MRNIVEIGRGKEARKVYRLADVDVVPSRRTRSATDVSTQWQIDAYTFQHPVVARPSDSIVSVDGAIEYSAQGGLAVLDAEGVWARHSDPHEILGAIAEAAINECDSDAAISALQQAHAADINEDYLAAAVEKIRDSGSTVAVRVSPQHAEKLAPILTSVGIDILVVQGTIISAEHVGSDGKEPLNLKKFIGDLAVPVIAGGVVNYRTALHLMRTGAAGVIVGSGSSGLGRSSTTDALGIDVGMATAISDAAAARRDYLDETGGRYVHIIADGEITTSGDIVRAIGCGADAVMAGELLAPAQTSPGQGVYWPSVAAHPSLPRGAVDVHWAADPVVEDHDQSTNISLTEILFGPTSSVNGTRNIIGGLRRSMAKCGYTDLKGFQKVELNVSQW